MSDPKKFPALVLSDSDNVAAMLDNASSKTEVQPGVICSQRISKGHKVAIAAIAEGEAVRKFGQIIGCDQARSGG